MPRLGALEAIEARGSTRAFQYREIEDAVLTGLLRAAVRAPRALDRDPWAFAVIQDRVLLRRISTRAAELWVQDPHALRSSAEAARLAADASAAEAHLFHGAGTLVVIGAQSNAPYADAECWLAAENLLIAATAWGLGTCLIGAVVSALSDPAVRSEIGFPPHFRPIVPVVVGYPRDRPVPGARSDPDVVVWRR